MNSLCACLDALTLALQSRTGLAGVAVFSAPVTPDDLGPEAIELAEEVQIETSRDSLNTQAEEYTISGSVLVLSPIAPGPNRQATINAAAKAARDRLAAILTEVTDCLAEDVTVSGTVRDAQIRTEAVHQGLAPEAGMGRVAWCEFSILVRSDVS